MNHKEEKKVSASGYKYLKYLPENGETDLDKCPVILFLHGAGEKGSDLDKLKTYGPPKLIKEGGNLPFMIVAPQCPTFQYWEPDRLKLLVDEILEFPETDKERIYITGVSMGGYGTWMLTCQYPDIFAAALPICGGGNPEQVHRMKNVPTWAFHGELDDIVPISETEKMVEALKKAGGNVKFTRYPDADHDSWTITYNTKDIFDWLLIQKKSEIIR